jgi:hypothetical protein
MPNGAAIRFEPQFVADAELREFSLHVHTLSHWDALMRFYLWYELYSEAFVITQNFQRSLPESLWQRPISQSVLSGEGFNRAKTELQPGWEHYVRQSPTPFVDICDGKLSITTEADVKHCDKRLVVEFDPEQWLKTFLMKTVDDIYRKGAFAFGPFFASSFSTTIVFYVSMLIFLLLSVAGRGLFLVIPSIAKKLIDARILREYPVWIVFSFGGLVPSVLIAWMGS